jgi:acyl-coenzyme A thioesterase PaaI-like protein
MGADGAISAYVIDGDEVMATDQARGPWFADQQHGAAVLAILTRFLERVPSAQPMRFTRITADLSRPVAVGPCRVTASARRDGRRVQSLEATVEVGGEVVSRAVATRIRVEPGIVPADRPFRHPEDEPPPFATVATPYDVHGPSFHDCIEVRQLDHADDVRFRTWFRMVHPLVAGEELTPVVRMACFADMVMSSSMRLGPGWISINPEVTLQVERDHVGEWVGLSTTVRLTDDGVGVSEGVMFDRIGRVGRSSKSVLNYPRPLPGV